MRAFAVSVCIN